MIGKFSLTNAINITAWTIYGEANNQSKAGKEAVASVIFNRAGGDQQKFISEQFKPMQFSTWNNDNPWRLKKTTSDAYWTYRPPAKTATNAKEAASWKDCVEIAQRLYSGKFKSTIGNRNSYLNKNVVAKTNPNVVSPTGWGTTMKDQTLIGDHTFGYQRNYDGFRSQNKNGTIAKNTTKQYVIQKGDTLDKIAKKFNTTSDAIAKNNNIKDKNRISIGQKIMI